MIGRVSFVFFATLCLATSAQAKEGFILGQPSQLETSIWEDAAAAPVRFQIDPAFSPEQKALIERAVSLIPSSQRLNLNGLRFVRSNQLDGPLDECTEGFYPGNGSIVLYPRCGFGAHIVVHEIFHHLGRFGNLNSLWKSRVLKKFPACPVSEYAAEGLGINNEDLAETGRLLLVPESGDRNPGACVDGKVAELRKILY